MNQATLEQTDDTTVTASPAELEFDELPVTPEQTEQVKGGRTDGPGSGGPLLNHNETVNEDDATAAEAEALDDLPTQDEEQVKGGRTEGPGSGGPLLNHNETVNEDDAEGDCALTDLRISDSQAEAIVAGSTSPDIIVTREDKDRRGVVNNVFTPALIVNHNESFVIEDESNERVSSAASESA